MSKVLWLFYCSKVLDFMDTVRHNDMNYRHVYVYVYVYVSVCVRVRMCTFSASISKIS